VTVSDLAEQAGAYLAQVHPCEACGCEAVGPSSLCDDCRLVREYLTMIDAAAEVPAGQMLSRAELVTRWLDSLS